MVAVFSGWSGSGSQSTPSSVLRAADRIHRAVSRAASRYDPGDAVLAGASGAAAARALNGRPAAAVPRKFLRDRRHMIVMLIEYRVINAPSQAGGPALPVAAGCLIPARTMLPYGPGGAGERLRRC